MTEIKTMAARYCKERFILGWTTYGFEETNGGLKDFS